ncbi:MAG: FKBP-type peptidyl-prolyl cis-trans isomerase [Galactobacter sp.]|uniref:FKBP-type peptidyl-prolyl cis-trans isomerase n=1 Tax=Galactobacter sp. TaxID=2676125 RepID=UPI0025BFB17B|nr:FKBP-type peptidyl-prolyl cis-trans isomerase [Galactobacter sp.]
MRKLPALALTGALILTLAACGSDDDKDSGSSSSPNASQSQEATKSAQANPATKVSKADAEAAKTPQTTSGDQTALKGLTFSAGKGDDATPKTSFAFPVSSKAKNGAAVVNEGKGEAIQEDKQLSLRIAPYNAETGEELSPGAWASAQQVVFNKTSLTSMEDAYAVLKKSKVGTDVGFYAPADKKTGSPAQLWVMRAESQKDMPKKASAAETKKLKADDALPTVKFSKGKPTITIPKGKDAPDDLIVDVIKEGDGKEATAESTVTAKYQGVRWEDGKVFDGSYDKDPQTAEFPLNGVIAGWTQGLTGLKEGSTVVLSIPTDLAYGENAEASGSPAGPLVFVVELDKVS